MIRILGINLDKNLNLENFRNKILGFLKDSEPSYLVTPNPEIILKAQKDEELFHILNKANLSLPDGFALKLAALLMGRRIKRMTGADALLEILKIAEREGRRVLIINNQNGLSSSEDIKKALLKNHPNLNFLIEEMDSSSVLGEKKDFLQINLKEKNFWGRVLKKIEKKINEKINPWFPNKIKNFSPEIMICNFGAPQQEKFVFHNFNKIPSLKLSLGIGGALDFLSGRVRRAPKIFRFCGLEWLWRLLKQPHRYKRIFQAVFVFPYKFFVWRFINPFFYRKNVVCLLYKKTPLNYTALDNKNRSPLEHHQILLVERVEEAGHWQLPQGGLDNESILRSGSRELFEELNIKEFYPQEIYKNIFKYKSKPGRYGYKGQRQSLLIARYDGSDAAIQVNYWDHSAWKWIPASDLVEASHPLRRKAAQIFLEKFKIFLEKRNP